MLLHCTKRLAAKLPHAHLRNVASAYSQDERTPLGEWHGLGSIDRSRPSDLFLRLCATTMQPSGLVKLGLQDLNPLSASAFDRTFLSTQDVVRGQCGGVSALRSE